MAIMWRAVGKPFNVTGSQLYFFIIFTCLLFYAGTVFCYFITLPFGIKFLLGFGSEELKPVISVGRFVNFVTLFILAFGLIFELVKRKDMLISNHGYDELTEDAIFVKDIIASVAKAIVIEDYPE